MSNGTQFAKAIEFNYVWLSFEHLENSRDKLKGVPLAYALLISLDRRFVPRIRAAQERLIIGALRFGICEVLLTNFGSS